MKTASLLALFLIIFSLNDALPSTYAQSEQSSGGRKVVSKVVPAYPPLARQMSLTGTVKVEVLVGANGQAKSMQVKGGSPLLAQAAQDALHNWRWEKTDHESSELIQFNFHP